MHKASWKPLGAGRSESWQQEARNIEEGVEQVKVVYCLVTDDTDETATEQYFTHSLQVSIFFVNYFHGFYIRLRLELLDRLVNVHVLDIWHMVMPWYM